MEKREWGYILLLAVLCTAVYANTFRNEFVFDDIALIIKNFEIRSFSNIPDFFTTPAHAGLYRPVRSVLYAVVFRIWGLNVFGYHLNSLIFHILNTVVVYFLANALLEKRRIALVAAIIFAVHPVHTERVTNMTAGFDQFGVLMYLLSFYLYILYSKTRNEVAHPQGFSKYYIVFSVIAFTVGILASEELVTLPVILLLYDFTFNKMKIKSKIKYYIPFILIGVVFFIIRFDVLGRFGRPTDYYTGSLYTNIITTLPIILKYFRLLVLPTNLSLIYEPPFYESISEPIVFIPLFAIFFILYLSIKSKSKIVFFSVFFFFITLLPFLNLVPLFTLMAERYLYVPSVSFCILAALLFNKTLKIKNFKAVSIVILIVILLSFSYLTIKRNSEWRDSVTLFTRTVETAPDSSKAHDSLGFSYQTEKRYEEALQEYEIAINLDPNNYFTHSNLGTAYAELGEYELAIPELQTSVLIAPYYYKGWNNLGLAYYRIGEYEEAEESLLRAVALHPEFSKAHNDLGTVYGKMGEYGAAIQQFQSAIKIYPGYKDAHYNLGIVYSRIGKDDLAQQEFRIAEKLPSDA